MEKPQIKWVIFGTGSIAQKFASTLSKTPNHKICGVISRTMKNAQSFIKQQSLEAIPIINENELFNLDFNCGYIATPHTIHKKNIIHLLQLNKNILVEKPLTTTLKDFNEIIEIHSKSNSFLMEAMWTVFQPATQKLKKIISSYGSPKSAFCDLGFKGEKKRLFDPELGGGALLDLGIYPISIFRLFFGNPASYNIQSNIKNHIDLESTGSFLYPDFKAAFRTSILNEYPNELTIEYEDFKIISKAPWWHGLEIIKQTKTENEVVYKELGDPFLYQILEVEKCISTNKKESTTHAVIESKKNLEILETIKTSGNPK